jgi:putative acetyltransferase
MHYKIVTMAPVDYDAVIAFWRQFIEIGLNESDQREPFERYLARNPGMSFVARDGAGAVVGAVLCGHDGRRGYLHHLAVASTYRRKRLGRALVDRCLGQLAAAGIAKCNVFVFNENADARRFWERMGYHAVKWSPMQRVINGQDSR